MVEKEYNYEREKRNEILGYIYKLVDDGWVIPGIDEEGSGKLEEIIETIEATIAWTSQTAMNRLAKERKKHKGAWLTRDVVEYYSMKAKLFRPQTRNQYIGRLKELGNELQEKYGVTEIEAINILFEHNTEDYINKYYQMEHLVPECPSYETICEDVVRSKLTG